MYLKSVENVITLGKLIGLLFLFCRPLLSILFLKTKRNDLARPVMGTIFLVNIYHMKFRLNTPVWGSLRSPNYVSMSFVCQINCIGGITLPTRKLKVIFGR